MPDLARRLAVARSDEPAELVVRGGRVFSAFTREWLEADVAVVDGYVAGIGERLHMHDFARAPQFLAAQVDLMAGENKAHGLFPSMLAVADLGQGAAALVLRRRDPAYAAAAKMRLSPAGLGDGTPIECMVSSVAAPSATSRLRSSAIFGFSIVSGRASR